MGDTTHLPVKDATLASTKLSKIVLALARVGCSRNQPSPLAPATICRVCFPAVKRLAGIGPQEALPPAAVRPAWGNKKIITLRLLCQRPLKRNSKNVFWSGFPFRGLRHPTRIGCVQPEGETRLALSTWSRPNPSLERIQRLCSRPLDGAPSTGRRRMLLALSELRNQLHRQQYRAD